MSPVISVEHLSKTYRLGQIGTGTFTYDLAMWWAKARGKPNPMLRIGEADHGNRDGEEIWALRDVSFTVEQGEVLGIIGRNGAGKSTLLKILSRVTAPTSGRIRVKGRVASLLEVGTGFHPELTGRENIYLNGAILGMTKAEVTRKFDEIVDFSGVEKFIDTPVKRYSSGMYVRLAFAVAAHLDPEILVVDEVLAVGDAEFQKKCLDKMGEVAQGGRTVLFVSHNMVAMQYLTKRSILLYAGSLVFDASTLDVIDRYTSESFCASNPKSDLIIDLYNHLGRVRGMHPCLRRMWITDRQGNILSVIPMGSDIVIHVEYEIDGVARQPIVGLVFESPYQGRLFSINNKIAPGAKVTNAPSKGLLSCYINHFPLNAGEYFITVSFARSVEKDIDRVEIACKVIVAQADLYNTGYIPSKEQGTYVLDGYWSFSDSTVRD